MSAIGKQGKAKRDRLVKRQRNQCFYCGQQMSKAGTPHPRSATLEHLVPRARGGSNALDNLVAACRECNEMKGSRIHAANMAKTQGKAGVSAD